MTRLEYGLLKLIHQTAAALSVTGFFARGLGDFVNARWAGTRTARTLPHLVDTVLLLSALALAFQLRLSPLAAPWLAAKIVGLIVYIVLGMIALGAGRPLRMRAVAWIAALLVFGYIVSVAISKNAWGLLSML